jgi:hypothetical protein
MHTHTYHECKKRAVEETSGREKRKGEGDGDMIKVYCICV